MFPLFGPTPSPRDNKYNCPNCGFRPCAVQCWVGLNAFQLEIYEEWLSRNDPWEPEEAEADDGDGDSD